ncbi:hypothetical protein ZWY2020_002063 [Hordeum vulgare]|nr:hypothetical protein ZWY2020_002063 [Hordeum vulgare]
MQVEVLAPAVRGTQNVLKACHQAKVGRVVVVSSAAAVAMNPSFPRDAVLDEDAWSDEDHCRTAGMWYALSKTLAEREALAHAGRTGLDVVTVCPPALGPGPAAAARGQHQQPGPHQPAQRQAFRPLRRRRRRRGGQGEERGGRPGPRRRARPGVRDPGGVRAGRYICGAYRKKLSEMAGIVRSFYPDMNQPKMFVQGEDDRMVSSKKLQALGWKFRAVEECLRDGVESYRAAGILPE